MKIKTTYSLGDKVFALHSMTPGGRFVAVPLTIGRVKIIITDSPGREGEETFDNYKPSKDRHEEYMCVETGIGTGQVYRVDQLFSSMELALAEARGRKE